MNGAFIRCIFISECSEVVIIINLYHLVIQNNDSLVANLPASGYHLRKGSCELLSPLSTPYTFFIGMVLSTPDYMTGLNMNIIHACNVRFMSSKYSFLVIPLSDPVRILIFKAG